MQGNVQLYRECTGHGWDDGDDDDEDDDDICKGMLKAWLGEPCQIFRQMTAKG